ncbi:DUF6531 domain-containing protein [Desulfonispora thiosulfatigenes]|uniref:DUF6531 domain-containing protein n=1 Tax=Desulfonispora thiosulfatigenes TaxID=83661 RepID=UPI00117D8668|nr:DUF6531 domain-containing protein [Desulfonispora thiosulfatigenes]
MNNLTKIRNIVYSGVPLDITKTYNSRKSNVAGIFGYGWTSNVEAQIVDAGDGPITLSRRR